MNDFAAEPQALREAELAAVSKVLRSGHYVLGPEVSAFERAWSQACGAQDCVGVANGLDAIEIGLRALRIGPGDEVITTSMTAFASVLAILRAGAVPVLADIDPATALIDLASLERCRTARTRAVLWVHLYGRLGPMNRVTSWAGASGVSLIEDCAQAHAAAFAGKTAGTFGVVGAYSFYPTKNLGAIGDAGAIVTSDAALAARCRVLRNYGQTDRMVHAEQGVNSRLDEIQAALLGVRLQWLQDFTAARRRIARRYREGIANPRVRLLADAPHADNHVHHLFVIACEDRDRLQQHLHRNGIQALTHYPLPIHWQEACRGIRCDPLGLANAERHAQTCLSLPCHPQLSDEDVGRVIEAVNAFS